MFFISSHLEHGITRLSVSAPNTDFPSGTESWSRLDGGSGVYCLISWVIPKEIECWRTVPPALFTVDGLLDGGVRSVIR